MTDSTDTTAAVPRRLVLFLGAVFALGSLGIDTMLPALSAIAADLRLANANHAQLIVTMFALGMGLGNLLAGPLSDRHGRRPVILVGCALYAGGALCALGAPALTVIFAGRMLQGVGAALATVAATALVRDRHAGVAMARIMSIAMRMFAMMPAIAPFLGQIIAALAGWRAIFAVYVVCGGLLGGYVATSVDETLCGGYSSLRLGTLLGRARAVLQVREVRLAIAAPTCNMSVLFSMLTSIQPIFEHAFGRAGAFPVYFALMALSIAASGLMNGKLVTRIGPRLVVNAAFAGGVLLSAATVLATPWVIPGTPGAFALFMVWAVGTFFLHGLAIGNLGALAMEPVGHLAGIASSIVASIPMVLATLFSIPVGLAFNGTPLPLQLAVLGFFGVGCVFALGLRHALESVPA